MKKSLLLMLLLALTWSWTAKADQLTVNDGTTTNIYVPIYGLYVDTQGAASEFVIPAETEGMSNMVGGQISKVTFYIPNPAETWGTPTIQLYMGEVDETTLSSISGPSAFTVVSSSIWSNQQNTLEVVFDNSYTYNGGNLLIGAIVQTKSSSYKTTYYAGVSAPSGSARYRTSSSGNGSAVAFLPKVTFEYTPGSGAVCDKPSSLAISDVTATGATLTWADGSGSFNVEYKKASDSEWTQLLSSTSELSSDLTSLEPATSYQARVQSVCGSDLSTWKTASFETPCGEYDIPYNYGFEDATPFSCWNAVSGVSIESSHARTGSKNLKFQGAKPLVILPAFADPINTLRLEIWARPESTTSNSGKLEVGYVTDPSDTATFVAVATFVNTDWASSSYEKKAIDFDNAPAGATMAMRQHDHSSSWYWFVDDITVKEKPSCLAPTALGAENITTNSADLSWTANSSESEWRLFVKKASEENYVEENGIITNPYTLQGLDPATEYQYYVIAKCDGSDESEASEAFSFVTECEAIDLNLSANDTLWFEKFDSYTAAAGFLPTCWNRINTCSYSSYGVSNYPRIYANSSYSTYANSAPNCLYLYSSAYYSSYDPQPQYAILPEMTNLAGKQITLQAKGATSTSTFKIGTMTNPADATTFTLIKEQNGLTTSYQEFTYNIPNTTTDSYVAIMIEAADEDRTTNGVYIDDIVIANPPACPKPTDLEATPSSQTATLTWNSEASGFDIAYSTDATANPDENVVGNSSTNTYSKSNLALDTDHYFWVRANCGTDGNSEWVGPISVHIGYCVPGPTSRDGKGIIGVAFGYGDDVVNNSDADGLPKASPYYGDYNDQIGAVQAGVESTIAITTSTGSYPYTFVIWVDFDNDLTFEDDEIIYTGKCASGAGTLNANITIPASQALGDYRMRIAGADSYFNSFYNNGGALDYTKDHDPCLTGSKYAVFHDYTLRVLEAPSCLKPTSLSVVDNSITANGVTISWDGTSDSYNVQYRTAANLAKVLLEDFEKEASFNANWSIVNFSTENATKIGREVSAKHDGSYGFRFSSYTSSSTYEEHLINKNELTGLTNGVIEFYFKKSNSSAESFKVGYSSTNSEISSFSFGENHEATETWQLFHEAIPAGTKYVSIQYTTTECNYYLYIDDIVIGNIIAAGQWQSVSSTETNKQLTGLAPETKYDVQVQGVCGGSTSDMSEVISFTTLPSCLPVSGLEVNNITASSADFSWAGNSGQIQWQYACALENASPVWSNENIVDATYVNVNGLSATTSYDFYVRAYCGVDDYSEAIKLNFHTECDVVSLPFSCGFENTDDLDCWTLVDCESSTGRYQGQTYAYEGSSSFKFVYNTNPPQYLISPELEASTNSVKVDFYYKKTSDSYEETFQVGYSTTNKSADSFIWDDEVEATMTYQRYSAVYPAGVKFVAIKYTANDMLALYIDNFKIHEFIPYELSINASRYATYYNEDDAYTMPEGLVGHIFNATDKLVQTYVANNVVPAGVPLVLEGNAGNYQLVPTLDAGVAPTGTNDLIGNNEAGIIGSATDGYVYYVLSMNASNEPESVGFYYMLDEGKGGFSMPAHKAYLKYTASSAPARFYLFNGENGATWLENLEGVEGTVKFMHEGNIYILRDSIIYDATGRKVRELK